MGNRRAAGRLTFALGLCWLAATAALADCRPDTVDLRGPGGAARFSVEVADSDAERALGLMHRDSLPRSAGMLFVYPEPGAASFWMKNTLIPLDMIFADATGTVTRVHAMAKPGDTTSIPGGDGVKLVLEINGGLAARLGIAPGSVMRHPSLDQDLAAWPCTD
jgi:hypothetical protein